MSLFISVGVVIELPDGSKVVSVMRADTSVNADTDSTDAEVLMALETLDRLGKAALGDARARLGEMGAVVNGIQHRDSS